MNLVWVLPFEPGWIGEGLVSSVANWDSFGWPASRRWGLVMTLVTLAVLAMPLRAWRDTSPASQD
jgi:hypothetical protein